MDSLRELKNILQVIKIQSVVGKGIKVILLPVDQLFPDIIPTLLIIREFWLEKIRKENQAENNENNEKLDQDDYPEPLPDGHGAKAIDVKTVKFS